MTLPATIRGQCARYGEALLRLATADGEVDRADVQSLGAQLSTFARELGAYAWSAMARERSEGRK